MSNRYQNMAAADEYDEDCYAEIEMEDTPTQSRRASQPNPNQNRHVDAQNMGSRRPQQQQQQEENEEQQQQHQEDGEEFDYDGYIDALREEMEAQNEENYNLAVAKAELEQQVAEALEARERAEEALAQEKEYSSQLEQRIAELEDQLASQGRGAERGYQQQQPQQQQQRPPPTPQQQQRQQQSAASSPSASMQQQQQQQQRAVPISRRAPFATYGGNEEAEEADRASSYRESRQQSIAPSGAQTPAAGSITGARRGRVHSDANDVYRTEADKSRMYSEGKNSTAALDEELLIHNQKREELVGELQRLEGKARTVADRKRKAELERELEGLEKVIGHVRLQLRSQKQLLM